VLLCLVTPLNFEVLLAAFALRRDAALTDTAAVPPETAGIPPVRLLLTEGSCNELA